MNFSYVLRQLGLLVGVLAVCVMAVAGYAGALWWSGATSERVACYALLATFGLGLVAGLSLWLPQRRREGELGRREALLLVAASWFLGAALAALPFYIWSHLRAASDDGAFSSYVDCYFEAMSGLTTTGATVLTSIAAVPKSLLFWRAMTQWLGGLGIVLLFVAVLPMLGVGGKRLFRVEAPGPTPEGVRPRIQETARALWMIYVGLTVAEILILRMLGMGWFDSVTHTLTTLATGGFSTLDSSIGGFASPALEWAIVFFMVLAGVNFGIYYQLLRRRWGILREDPELRLYLVILAVGFLVVLVGIWNAPIHTTAGDELAPGTGNAIRTAAFQVVSVQTTTGFCTVDFNQWSFLPKVTLLILMFVGASAGSTGGGLKVMRCLIAFKVMLAELEHVFRPNVIRTVKVGKSVVDSELKLTTLAYFLAIGTIFCMGTILLMIFESSESIDVVTAATATIATLNNIGPGLARVGAIENFAWFSAPSKLLMSLLMALGRLELFAILVLFVPRFWRSE
ncbi:MAG: TrkH family potassium uptake protein [Planctomycetes bacterium]|nr:TrkH family potassium uptake protein [Planctomycetota bacterium]